MHYHACKLIIDVDVVVIVVLMLVSLLVTVAVPVVIYATHIAVTDDTIRHVYNCLLQTMLIVSQQETKQRK